MKRVICTFFAVIVFCLSFTAVSAEKTDADYGFEGSIESDAVYLEELNTGTVVYEHYADESYRSRIYPASTTKVMTYIVVAENVPDPDKTMIEITDESLADLDPDSSVMGLAYHIGESFSVTDLLYGLMLPSGNDAALVLAEYVGGEEGVDGFVDLMNRKAAQIGCKDTHFTSPHGLHDYNHYTTLLDMATITKYAMMIDGFMDICSTVSYKPAGFDEEIRTTNYLLDENAEGGEYYYPYAKGIKTGYTDEAGKCLISTAEKDGCRYLCIAMGADYSFVENVNYAMLDTVKLYDWAFDTLTLTAVYDTSTVIKSLPVKYVWGNKMLDLVPEKAVTILLPKEEVMQELKESRGITFEITHTLNLSNDDDAVAAPIRKGEVFGTMTVTCTITEKDLNDPNKIIRKQELQAGKTNIVAAEDIGRQELNYVVQKTTDFIGDHIVLFIILLLVLIVLIIILIRYLSRKKARRRRSRARISRERNSE